MKNLKEYILNENNFFKNLGIGMRPQLEKWLKDNKIGDYEINDDTLEVNLKVKSDVYLTEPLPEYVRLTNINKLTITSEDATEIFKSLPECLKSYTLIVNDSVIENFENLQNKCLYLIVNNCEIKSLKGLPTCKSICLGNNKQHFSIKEIKKYTKTKDVSNMGAYNEYAYNWDSLKIGENDKQYLEEFKKDLQDIKKIVPEIKGVFVKPFGGNVYIRLDYTNPDGTEIRDQLSGIYLEFVYNFESSSLELNSTGHMNLTQKDKEGKYKYYTLKSFLAPLIDNGGKKFRKTSLDDLTYSEFIKKTKDFIVNVTNAAVEDQGGELKRY